MCKWSDPFSKRVLIGRGLDHNSLEYLKSTRSSSDYSVLKARPSKKYWTEAQRCAILIQSDRSVSMTVRFHLFPFRTQKLSSLVPKIVRWKRRVKIGSRRLFIWPVGQAVKTEASHAFNIGSIPVRVTILVVKRLCAVLYRCLFSSVG